MTAFIIGKMLGVEGALLLIPAMVAFLYGEKSGLTFLMVSAILFIIYFIFGRKKPGNKMIYGKEGLGNRWFRPGFCGHCSGQCPFSFPGVSQTIWMPFLDDSVRIYHNWFYLY